MLGSQNNRIIMKNNRDDVAQIWANEDYQFQGQRSDESVMLVRNQHLVVLWRLVVGCVVSLVVPWLELRSLDGMGMVWGLVVYIIILVFFVWQRIFTYRSSVMILSNQRIINVTQKGFFNRTINEAELSRIQDVSSEIKGPLQTAFQFGTVTVRTASNDTKLVIQNIVDPYGAQQSIVRALKDVQ